MIVRRGFTLIELLVVISIIGLLVGILLPALSSARSTAITLKCATQIKQIGYGFAMYHNDFDDRMPFAVYTDYPNNNVQTYDDLIATYTGHHLTAIEKAKNQLPLNRSNPLMVCPADDVELPANESQYAKRSYSMVQGWQSTTSINKGRQPPGVGIITSAAQFTYSNMAYQFIVSSQDIPSPSDTLLVSERLYTAARYPNLQGRYNGTARTGLLRKASEQTGDAVNPYGWETVFPHGNKRNPLYNYLYVDGHVKTLTPTETIGPSASINSSNSKGQWTRTNKD